MLEHVFENIPSEMAIWIKDREVVKLDQLITLTNRYKESRGEPMVKGKGKEKPTSKGTAVNNSKSQNGKSQVQTQNTSQKSNNSKKNSNSYKGNNRRPRLPMNDDKV